jgi:hypothetical protein
MRRSETWGDQAVRPNGRRAQRSAKVYATARRYDEPISTATTESTVQWLRDRRMGAQQQLRWLPRGAHLMFKVRTLVVKGDFNHDQLMISSDCPQTYVSRSPVNLATSAAVVPPYVAISAVASSLTSASPIRSGARSTSRCHRAQLAPFWQPTDRIFR